MAEAKSLCSVLQHQGCAFLLQGCSAAQHVGSGVPPPLGCSEHSTAFPYRNCIFMPFLCFSTSSNQEEKRSQADIFGLDEERPVTSGSRTGEALLSTWQHCSLQQPSTSGCAHTFNPNSLPCEAARTSQACS